MQVYKAIALALAFSVTALPLAAEPAGPAQAEAPQKVSDAPITGIMAVRNADNQSAVSVTTIPDLQSKEQCLAIAWVTSVRNNDTWSHKEANITCLQEDKVIGAQTCVNGNCTALDP